ncbi:FtsX-like permease family protein [Nitrospirillum sp. BR 11163]|uniref:FtsX-like permease family protein n=1 Tax=Nitrospirillum sp. BR 11163 TaxID=3104323 RepID=UPI002B0034A5|nr:FtsX-like permease family protein [Nitrospirillum sp. BR 11163]MEA1671950.1 FtsX-like permease family protein [Nitrospirillum sp. BR 11163]
MGGSYFFTYVRLKPGADAASIEERLPDFVDRTLPSSLTRLLKGAPHDFYRFRLIPVTDVHFDGGEIGAMKPPESRATLLALTVVALLILAIAAINFANLAMARSMVRTREVALRKVLGASAVQVMAQFLVEAMLLTVIGCFVGLVAIELARPTLTARLGLESAALRLTDWRLWAGVGLLVPFTALVSGGYPAAAVSRTKPAQALNREAGRRRTNSVRSLLVIGQFAVSIALIAITATVSMQLHFARNVDLGFRPDNLVILRVPDDANRSHVGLALKEAMARIPGVADASLSSAVPFDPAEDNISIALPGAAKPVAVGYHVVDADFFATYGVAPSAGRVTATLTADQAEAALPVQPAVINMAAVTRLGFSSPVSAVGQTIRTRGDQGLPYRRRRSKYSVSADPSAHSRRIVRLEHDTWRRLDGPAGRARLQIGP